MIRAYLYALDPTPAQAEAFRSHCGAQRFAYNWGLALVKANLSQREAERSYGIDDNQLTEGLDWSAYALRRTWNTTKATVAPWWAENSKEAYSSGLANLSTALHNWMASKSGARVGPRISFPHFKSIRGRRTCRFTTGIMRLGTDRHHVQMPRIGLVRTCESTRKLARQIDRGTGQILSMTVSWQRGRWHVALSVNLQVRPPLERSGRQIVGIDLGIKSLAVLSTSEVVPNPRHLDSALAAVRRMQRMCSRRQRPDRRTRQGPSNRWRKAQVRVTTLHTHVGNQRRDGLHKLTTRLVRDYDVVVIEDLNIAGMVRNRCLARHISELGVGEFRRQLTYKAAAAGVRLIVADRWYPSSKTCSVCGAVRAKLTLAERMFVCESCGLRLDRDLNAARNLAALAEQASEQSCGRTLNKPAGNPRKTDLIGNGYCHGKTPATEPTPHREVMAPLKKWNGGYGTGSGHPTRHHLTFGR